MKLKEDRIIHRFIRDASEYESGGEYYNQVIPVDTQAYAIYSSGEKSGLYYVMGDDAHTYAEIRNGYGSKKSAKEYPVFTTEHVNTINRKADKSYVDTEFINAENKWTAQVNAERSRAEGAENTITIALNDETARAVLEEDTLNKKINAETNRATTEENKITSNLNTHTNNKSNPHSVTKAQVGLGNCDNTSDVNKPISTATQAALDTLTTNLEAEVTRATGRENSINNTLTAEITRATNREDTIEADLTAHSTSNTNPHNVTKTQVGLGNCDNTSDVNKPVSKATQQELDTLTDNLNTEVTRATTKEDLINSALSSEVTRAKAAEKTLTDNLEKEITRATDKETAVETSLNTHKTNKNNPHEVTKSQVGLGNCDNTADIDKPVSTAVQSALEGKADKATTLSGYNITDAYTKEEIESTYAKSVAVPTKVSQLENDSGYLTTHQDISGKADLGYVDEELTKKQNVGDYALKSEIPTIPSNVSDFVNDAGYITDTYHDDTKQDVISDLTEIREGASKGATALQSYTETDPVYTADKPNLALKSEIPTIPTNISSFTNDAGYLTEIPEDYLTVEEASRVYATNADLAEKANSTDLATVATSGSYEDLLNKPTIPAEYELPTASESVLGGVKVDGASIEITNGVISAAATPGAKCYIYGNKSIPSIESGLDSQAYLPVDRLNNYSVDDGMILKKGDVLIDYVGNVAQVSNVNTSVLPVGSGGFKVTTSDLKVKLQTRTDDTLTTTDKTLVGAINELVTKIAALEARIVELESKP